MSHLPAMNGVNYLSYCKIANKKSWIRGDSLLFVSNACVYHLTATSLLYHDLSEDSEHF